MMRRIVVGLALAAFVVGAWSKGPHVASAEELVEQADAWLLDFDDDEDGKLSLEEMEPVLESMRAASSVSAEQSAQLTAPVMMRMADADGDGAADRPELIDMLKRMKGFAAGRLDRADAASPQAENVAKSARDSGYSESHAERMRKKGKRKGGARKRAGQADQTLQPPKDEM